MFYLDLRHVTMKITPPGLDRQFQETGSMFLRNIFFPAIDLFHCHATKNQIGNGPVEEAKKINML